MSMLELSKLPENLHCADCGAQDSSWASINLGLFICIKCAGVHRNLGVHISKVRSLDLDTACWDAEQIAFMRSIGNVNARAKFEARAPQYFIRPSETDNPLVREAWIRAKYEKKLFIDSGHPDDDPSISHMPEAGREGFMWKESGGSEGKFQKRWFILFGNRLSYYKEAGDAEAVKWFDVSGCSVSVPDSNEAAKKYMFNIHASERVYQVYPETERDMFDWIHAIRRAGLYYGKLGHTFASQTSPAPPFTEQSLTRARLSGPMQKCESGFFSFNNKCWFVLTDEALYLFSSQPEHGTMPESGISLLYAFCADAKQKNKKDHTLCVVTLDKNYFFQASDDKEMWKWINAIGEATNYCTPREAVDFKRVSYP